jgi:type I restriction enzyme M protein
MIDGKNFVNGSNKNSIKQLLDQELLRAIENPEHNNNVQSVPLDKINQNTYSLYVPKYLQNEVTGVALGEISEIISLPRVSDSDKPYKLVRIRDLKDDKLNCFLDVKQLEETSTTRQDLRILKESALLLATRWNILKPTYFKYEEIPIVVPGDIIALKLDESRVSPSFLASELHEKYVEEQVSSYRVGGTVPSLPWEDLMAVKIQLPSLKEQFTKVLTSEEWSKKIKDLQIQQEILFKRYASTQFTEFASLKHTLGRPRQNILDWATIVHDFLMENVSESKALNNKFSQAYGLDMISAVMEIKRDINFISEVLEKGENGMILNNYPLELISLFEINQIVNELNQNQFFFKIKTLALEGDNLRNRAIRANRILLKTLFDNILTNANKHGFNGSQESNELVIELTDVQIVLMIEIKNNGVPFPKNFDKDKFVNKYSTADPDKGSGLGGYDINRIARYLGDPDWDLILNDDPIYPVKFKFQFDIQLIG